MFGKKKHHGPKPDEDTSAAPEISDPNDIALLQTLRGAAFGPDSTVTLPSGRVLIAHQIRELTEDS